MKAANYHVVGDASPTVGVTGGWVQGGGHSFSSPAFGLGVDNVLKFTVVLADRTVVQASPCANPDLFWALRGGGGGTFGVVTSAVYKLYPKQTVTGYEFDFRPRTNQGRIDLLTAFFTWVADVSTKASDVVVGGYPVLYGSSLGGNLAGRLVINGTLAQAQKLLAPLKIKIDTLVAQNATQTTSIMAEKASFLAWREELAVDPVGTLANSVSRLIPTSLCAQPEKLVKVLTDYTVANPLFIGKLKLVAGGAVSTANPDSKQTSVTPSWRDSCVHLMVSDLAQAVVTIVPTNIFASTQEDVAVKNQAVSAMGVALREVAGSQRGAYFGESDYTESDWKQVFWGKANYDTLLVIKRKLDLKGVLSCHHCVGEGEDFTVTRAPSTISTTEPTAAEPTATIQSTMAPTTEVPTTTTASTTIEPTTEAPATTTTSETIEPASTTDSPTITTTSTTSVPTTATATNTPTTTREPAPETPTATTTSTTIEPTTATASTTAVPTTTPVSITVVPTTIVTTTGVTNTTVASTTTAPSPTPSPPPDVSAKTSGSASAFSAGGLTLPIILITQVMLLGSWIFFRDQ